MRFMTAMVLLFLFTGSAFAGVGFNIYGPSLSLDGERPDQNDRLDGQWGLGLQRRARRGLSAIVDGCDTASRSFVVLVAGHVLRVRPGRRLGLRYDLSVRQESRRPRSSRTS
jgi:hypothetical protein